MNPQQQITQHKRLVPYGTHPNSCFAKTSFMLEPLYARILRILIGAKNFIKTFGKQAVSV